jgi:Mg2+-importing ATPase
MEQGLTSAQASSLLQKFGPNSLATESKTSAIRLFFAQLRSPLVLILVAAATVSLFVREWVDAGIVLIVIFGSAVLSFLQGYSATRAMEKLRQRVQAKATVLRDGKPVAIPLEGVVPGDVVLLSAGSLIPADATVFEARDCFVNQAVLTGETYPAEKRPGAIPASASLAERTSTVFLGTSVRSGTARALVIETGPRTAFGQIAGKLTLRPPETGFEQGIQNFGYLLTKVMIALAFSA